MFSEVPKHYSMIREANGEVGWGASASITYPQSHLAVNPQSK